MCTDARRQLQHGATLVELIVFIVIIGIGLAGILLVMNSATRASVDPLVRKQSLAIAEALLEEVQLMPFTFCDPDDAVVETAGSAAACTTAEGLGPEGGEGRYAAPQFDNVSDYNGFAMTPVNGGIRDIQNSQILPAGYTANVAVSNIGFAGIAASEALLVRVTVTGPDNQPVILEGVRTRYAPNAAS